MTTGQRGTRGWIVLVARGDRDLYEHLRHAFEADGKVEVVMDRRVDPRRTQLLLDGPLSAHGVDLICKEA